MSIQFRTHDGEPTALGRVLLAWWNGLDDDRGSRAILRRAASPTQVALTAPYQRAPSACGVPLHPRRRPAVVQAGAFRVNP